ncbi:MAG: EI24 domain-containing protein, partial [Bacteroidia bacterium]
QISFFKQFSIAVKSYGKAISLLFNNGLWIYLIYPIIISILLFAAEFYFLDQIYISFENKIKNRIDFGNPHLWMFFRFFLSAGFYLIFFLIDYFFWKYIVLIFMSPVMTILSEKTETILTGQKYCFSAKQSVLNIVRSIGITFRNMFFQLLIVAASCFVIWIPVIGWLCPVFLLIISYYFYGFSMLDYVSERRKLSISGSIRFVRANKGLAIGNGFIFTLLFAVPYAGVVISTVLSPIAACISIVEKESEI